MTKSLPTRHDLMIRAKLSQNELEKNFAVDGIAKGKTPNRVLPTNVH